MKYMTPELLVSVRSEDDSVAEAAAEEWERRGEEYRARLEALRDGARRHAFPDRLGEVAHAVPRSARSFAQPP